MMTEKKVDKKRNKKLNTFLMVIYVASILVITIPELFFVLLTPVGREWTNVYPRQFADMTFQALGVVIMSLLSWGFMIWLYYDVMGGRSLIDRLKERR